jgi:peroxiredoxin
LYEWYGLLPPSCTLNAFYEAIPISSEPQRFVGDRLIVHFFYAKDGTPPEAGTNEACAFSDNYEGFETLNANVIWMSPESGE